MSYFKIVLPLWTGFFFIFNNFLIIFKFGFQFIFRIIYLRRNDEEREKIDNRKVDRRDE